MQRKAEGFCFHNQVCGTFSPRRGAHVVAKDQIAPSSSSNYIPFRHEIGLQSD